VEVRVARWLGLLAAISLPGAVGRAVAEEPKLPSFDAIVLATPHDPDARATTLLSLHADKGVVRSSVLGTVPHVPGAVVRGDVRGGTAWVVADEGRGDWTAALFEVGPSGSRRILGGVGHARRPLVAESGAIFVERGALGAWPSDAEIKLGALRVDPIDLDAYEPASGVVRHVYSAQAYALHLAGEVGGELVVYRVDRAGASIIAVDERSGSSRVVAALPPYARDFSIDAHGALVSSNRDPGDARWVVSRLDLRSGTFARLHAASDEEPSALAMPSGLAWSSEARRGLTLALPGATREIAPLGAGFDAPTLATRDGALIAFNHVEVGGYDRAAVLDVSSGRAVRLGTDERITVLALRGATGGVR
jgi:hypothetical protein